VSWPRQEYLDSHATSKSMNVCEDCVWNHKRIRQPRRTNFRNPARVTLCIAFVFLLHFNKICAFQSTKHIFARQRFTAVCDRFLGERRRRRNIGRRPLVAGTHSKTMATNHENEYGNPLARLGLPEPLLLGSASFTRKLILKEMGVPFSKFVRPIDEKALGDRTENAPPKELVLLLANAKMDRLVTELEENKPDDLPQNNGEFVVLTGDQVVTCGGKILEKPESVEEAKEFVKSYASSPPSTVGSVVLYHHPSGTRVDGVDTATIHFNPETLKGDGSSTLIDSLIEQGEPVMSCAGGLMIEHPLTRQHVDKIDGTEDSVMGLSKDLVLRLLQELAKKQPKES